MDTSKSSARSVKPTATDYRETATLYSLTAKALSLCGHAKEANAARALAYISLLRMRNARRAA